MTLEDIWKIKEDKSQQVKDMTVSQLKEYYADSLLEFCRITGQKFTVVVDPADKEKQHIAANIV